MFSRCLFVRPSVRSSHLTCDHDILKINEKILMSIDNKWSMWHGHETVNFVVSSLKVKVI